MSQAPTAISQNPDVRYLGKLLGDVIRAYGGQDLFQRIESIRASSVDRHRGLDRARVEGPDLRALTPEETLSFVRSFMLFSMLANLAEDRQAGQNETTVDLAGALSRLAAQDTRPAQVAELLDGALIAPVLTAHPTEVMRKSMIDHRNRIADLMRQRDLGLLETAEGDVIEHAIVRGTPKAVSAGHQRSECDAVTHQPRRQGRRVERRHESQSAQCRE